VPVRCAIEGKPYASLRGRRLGCSIIRDPTGQGGSRDCRWRKSLKRGRAGRRLGAGYSRQAVGRSLRRLAARRRGQGTDAYGELSVTAGGVNRHDPQRQRDAGKTHSPSRESHHSPSLIDGCASPRGGGQAEKGDGRQKKGKNPPRHANRQRRKSRPKSWKGRMPRRATNASNKRACYKACQRRRSQKKKTFPRQSRKSG